MDIDANQQVARRPQWQMLLNPVHCLALGLGAGLSPIAPGTIATLGAWAIFVCLAPWLAPVHWGLLIVFGVVFGVYFCERTGKVLNAYDHSAIVWDEIIAFWLVLLLLTPSDWSTQLWAFLWFRFFDIVKPGPIRYVEKRLNGAGWRGGVGVMLDDLLAAFFTVLLFAIWRIL